MVDANALQYFTAVALSGSISRAASELGMEPSTLTRHIGRLEDEVGIRLFHRSGRGMALTDAGAVLLKEAQQLGEALRRAQDVASDLGGAGPARIVLAAMPTIAHMCFVPLAKALRARFPRIQLQLREGFGHEIMNWLQNGQIDLALFYVPSRSQIVDYDFLLQEQLYCVMPAGGPIPSTPLPVKEFAGLPLILPSTAHGLRALAEDWARQAGRSLNVVMECDGSNLNTLRLVQAGLGCTLLPLAAVHDEVRQGLLQAAPLAGKGALRSIALATARNRTPTTGLAQVTDVLRATVADLVKKGQWPGVERPAG